MRLELLDRGKDLLELGFGGEKNPAAPRDAQPVRTAANLIHGLLAADIKDAQFFVLGMKPARHLKQQRAFADPGIAAQKHEAVRDQSPAQHSIELFHPRRQAPLLAARARARGILLFGSLGIERDPIAPTAHSSRAKSAVHSCHFHHGIAGRFVFGLRPLFEHRVPRFATRTPAQPLRGVIAAILTRVLGSDLAHSILLLWVMPRPSTSLF